MQDNSAVDQLNARARTIESVHAAAAYEVAADNIRRAIALGRFLPGDKLPPERELSEQMQVSRTTIREAVRVLEGEGLITVKRGALGGLVVMRPPSLGSAEMGAYLRTQLRLIYEILDFRTANECFAARLACGRRTQSHLDCLAELLGTMSGLCAQKAKREDVSNISQFLAADAEFHLTIAHAAGNKLIGKAVGDAHAAMFMPIGRVFKRLEDRANAHHETIYAAIRDQDADRAEKEMSLHIAATRKSLRNLLPPNAELSND
ncbi:MAG: FadR family transcriptional regulator [Roseitalea sp.]|uniref:FadR/GntR family transcriptional regulator n=1 Tax=Oceaniradius stylonematis TaxID=2184161 RepID=UPI000D6BB826|nr:FadR family transcriptional regulator [Roseitalea sp.]MBO6953338.1 FadR family transcriptional regulator [Rhizobiaceae bacterium]MCR9194142.1 FadR family transcriptional regulator [Hyphomonas sp.]MBO6593685.1 FadR family transcriptional regulator [Roseitalea sp.]MBO6601081.1 FadR family transcriptional regulator [Roseitalea sp.]